MLSVWVNIWKRIFFWRKKSYKNKNQTSIISLIRLGPIAQMGYDSRFGVLSYMGYKFEVKKKLEMFDFGINMVNLH